jgi:hypothetical protein
MTEQAEILIREIAELRSQYVAEVGEGRRKWPRSIKERAEKLDEMGVPAKQVGLKTGIGYETLLQWRYKRRHEFKKRFHEIKVPVKALAKIDTVTVPKAKEILKVGTVTVTTPEGFRVEVLNVELAIELLKSLRVR